jgi:hypothetical protein
MLRILKLIKKVKKVDHKPLAAQSVNFIQVRWLLNCYQSKILRENIILKPTGVVVVKFHV